MTRGVVALRVAALGMVLLAVGCTRPWPAGGRAVQSESAVPGPDDAAAPPLAETNPARPGVRWPGRVRAEAFWDEGVRYRFLDRPHFRW